MIAWAERIAGPALIVGGALALPLALFLPWYDPGLCPPGQACTLIYRPTVSGWDAFSYLDALIAAAAVGALVAATIGWVFRLRLAFLAVTLIGGGLGVIVIFAAERPANPAAYGAPTHIGYLLALLACGALLAGGLWAALTHTGDGDEPA